MNQLFRFLGRVRTVKCPMIKIFQSHHLETKLRKWLPEKNNSVSSGWQPFFRAHMSSQDLTLTTKEKEATIEHE